MPDTPQCSATIRSGAMCSARYYKDGKCAFHHPDNIEKIREGRRNGGRAKSNARRARKELQADAMSVADLRAVLSRAVRRVEAGEMEPGPANALATLSRAMLAVDNAADLEERIAMLEERAGLTA